MTGVVERLRAAGCVAAEEEAEELTAAASDDATLEEWVSRREQGEPLAWITRSTRFCGHVVRVDPGVYVPRTQSEEFARRAASVLAEFRGGHAADLCTGSGAIAVHLKHHAPRSRVVAVDIDLRAVVCSRRNGVNVLQGDLDAPLSSNTFDVVTAVTPYVPTGCLGLLPRDVQRYEPRLALDGGEDGLDLLRRVVAGAARILRPGGWLFVEVGDEQDDALRASLEESGFGSSEPWYDEDFELRGVAARLQRDVL